MLTELVRCCCDHTIADHGADGCEGPRCRCRLRADEVLEAAIASARLQWGAPEASAGLPNG